MNILVIGGTLFIGRALVQALLKQGHEVTILHRNPKHTLGKQVRSLIADRNDANAVRDVLAGHRFDIVFDNVYDNTTAEQVIGTVRAVRSFDRYIFMSSVAAYGDGLDHREDDPLAPNRHPDRYVRNKAMTERALFRLHHKEKLPVVTLRPPYIYGPGNPYYREAFFWDRIRAGRPVIIPGDGTRLMQFVFIDDLVAACFAAMTVKNAVGQAFNVADARPVSQTRFVQMLGDAAGQKPHLVNVPRVTIERAGGNIYSDPMYFGQYLDLPPITMQVHRLRRILGVKPTPLSEGLRTTYAWYSKQKPGKLDIAFEDSLLSQVQAVASMNGVSAKRARAPRTTKV
jgi:nucleoside-diphosphate-sugar epimerase